MNEVVEELKKEISTLQYERVVVELNALAEDPNCVEYSAEDEETLYEIDERVSVLKEELQMYVK